MRRGYGILMAMAVWAAAGVRAEDAAVPAWKSPVGPDGVTRIIVEAEDMVGVKTSKFGGTAPEWRLGRAGIDCYQNNVFGGHWQSRCATAMTDAGDKAASLSADVQVPKAGKYKLWVKYECPPIFNYAFEVTVTPKGAAAPALKKTYGLLDNPKHFCFTDTLTTGSLYWTWGIDHDAAEGYELELPAGPCRIALVKTKNPAPAGMRSIDVLMLTDDLSPLSAPKFPRYPLLDELRRANHVFMRFVVDTKAPGPVAITWDRWGKRYNDFYHAQYMELVRYYAADGSALTGADGKPVVRQDGQLPGPVKPGETSPWLDVGPCLNVESAATFICTASLVDDKGAALKDQPGFIPCVAEFALAPTYKKPVKSFAMAPADNRQMTFLLQPDLRTAEGLDWSLRLADVYRRVTADLEKEKREWPMPRRMRFFSGTGSIGLGAESGEHWELRKLFRFAHGLNTPDGGATIQMPAEYARQREWAKAHGYELLRGGCYHHSQEVEKMAATILGAECKNDFYYLSYGDEIGLPAVDATKPEMVTGFHEFLKSAGVTPAELGLPGWDQVKPLNSLAADVAVKIGVLPDGQGGGAAVDRTLKRLYWHSCRFRVHTGVADFAAKTKTFREMMGPDVHTSANLGGMHPFYWMHQSSFIEAFKYNAMSLAWTEDYDYCMPETSRLVAEFQAGYLKAGTKYNGQRMMFYCMPHYPGNSPEHLLQNVVLLWGQNVKDLDWFCTPPDGFTTENYVNPRGGIPTFKAMRKASEMAGAVEHVLEPAQPVPASVAMLLSEASDLWEICGLDQGAVAPGSVATNAFQEERKNTYYILRHAGYRVDLVTEADVRDGVLAKQKYRVLYVGGENMERKTAATLAEWVKGGGILYASVGAARKDEYDEPLTALDEVLGRGKQLACERYKGALRSKIELPFLKTLATVKAVAGTQTFPALATLELFEPAAGAATLATFEIGTPAMVMAKSGTGRGYYIGTMPAAAWAQKALPQLPCGKGGPESKVHYPQFEPVAYDAAAAALVLKPVQDAALPPDFVVNQPHIVCNRLTGPAGTAVTVVNLGATQLGPAKAVTIGIVGIAAAPKKVWSYGQPKGLQSALKDGRLTVTLPDLGLVDVIVLE